MKIFNSNIAIVAAGGIGKRFGSNAPKSLIEINSIPVIHYTITPLIDLELSKIIICAEDDYYLSIYKKEFKTIKNIYYELSPICDSTIKVVRHTISTNKLNNCNILFLYGHTPRTSSYLQAIMNRNNLLSIGLTKKSTKRNLMIYYYNNIKYYIEPPYFINIDLLINNKYESWNSFMVINGSSIVGFPINGPPEFNYKYEFDHFKKYILETNLSSNLGFF